MAAHCARSHSLRIFQQTEILTILKDRIKKMASRLDQVEAPDLELWMVNNLRVDELGTNRCMFYTIIMHP